MNQVYFIPYIPVFVCFLEKERKVLGDRWMTVPSSSKSFGEWFRAGDASSIPHSSDGFSQVFGLKWAAITPLLHDVKSCDTSKWRLHTEPHKSFISLVTFFYYFADENFGDSGHGDHDVLWYRTSGNGLHQLERKKT